MTSQRVIVPSFIQGVSTQADTQKMAATATDIQNGYPDIATGLKKRNPIKFNRTLAVASPQFAYEYHWLSSGSTRFLLFLVDDATEPIQVFNVSTGVKSTVDFETGTKDYVNAGALDGRWRVLSVFDSTFILNQTVVTALQGAAETYTVQKVLLDISELFTPTIDIINNVIYKTLNSTVGRPAGFYRSRPTYSVNDVDNFIRLKSPAALSDIDPATMPVQMVYNSITNTFNVQRPDWRDRFSGDELTNPGPSFIGRPLTDIVFHKNRLWLFADETVVASRGGDFFNFWIDDITNLTQADPIDEFVTDEGINKIIFAVPFSESLVLFTEGDRQFEIRSVGPMAPDSISIIPTTDYGVDKRVRPIRSGNSMYFFTPFIDYGQMMEYFYIENAASNVAQNVTEHVKGYIDASITKLSPDVNSGLMVAHGDDVTTMYPYRVKHSGQEKVQSAWSKWTLPTTGHKVATSRIINDDLFMLLKVVGATTTKYVLTSMSVELGTTFPAVNYPVHLDLFETRNSGTYNAATNTTYWDLSYNVGTAKPTVVRTTGVGGGLAVQNTTTTQSEHVTRVTCPGNLASSPVIIGIPFTYSVTLNTPYVKDQNGAVVTGSFSLQKLVLYVRNVVQFLVGQKSEGISQTYEATYSASQTASLSAALNNVPVTDFNDPTFIILGKATESTITISDTSEFPMTLVSAEFRGNFSARRPVR
jgi:hypothetical protein